MSNEEYGKLASTFAKYTNTVEYKSMIAERDAMDFRKDVRKHPMKLRNWLAVVESHLQKIDPDICLGYFDWTRYYNRIPESPACAKTAKPAPKPYAACSIETLTTLQRGCISDKSKHPYTNFVTQFDVYATAADSLMKDAYAQQPLLRFLKHAFDDKAHADYQIGLVVDRKGDTTLQYEGDLESDCGHGKKVKDILDTRDLCYGYILPGTNEKPAVKKIDKAAVPTAPTAAPILVPTNTTAVNSTMLKPTNATATSSVGDAVFYLKTKEADKYSIRSCPKEYFPTGYVAPKEAPKGCPVKEYLAAYNNAYGIKVTDADLAKFADEDADYSKIPGEIGIYVSQCYKRQQEVAEQVATGNYKLVPLTPDYTAGDYPYTGVAAQESTASGTIKSLVSCVGVIIAAAAFFF